MSEFRESLIDLQDRSSIYRRTSLAKDAVEFEERFHSPWKDSSKVSRCSLCNSKFTLTHRKHHCRQCGEVFCSKCSSYKLVINGTLKRACFNCYKNTYQSDSSSFILHSHDLHPSENGTTTINHNQVDSTASKLPVGSASPRPLFDPVSRLSSQQSSQAVHETPTVSVATTPAVKPETNRFQHSLPSWAEAIVYARLIGNNLKNSRSTMFPEAAIPASILNDIILNAFPIEALLHLEQDIVFMFRVRKKYDDWKFEDGEDGEEDKDIHRLRNSNASDLHVDPPHRPIPTHSYHANSPSTGSALDITKTTMFYNCYVLLKKNSSFYLNEGEAVIEDMLYQATILVTKWPFYPLAAQILVKLDEALYWNIEGAKRKASQSSSQEDNRELEAQWKDFDSSIYSDSNNPTGSEQLVDLDIDVLQKDNEVSMDTIQDALMSAFGQISMWPPPSPGSLAYFHFLGEMIHYQVPSDILSTFGANISFASLFNTINLISLFGPCGLVQHMWALWEHVISGHDIIVYAEDPNICGEFVLGLSSLLLPIAHIGDVRPFIHHEDTDLPLLNATALWKQENLFSSNDSQPGPKNPAASVVSSNSPSPVPEDIGDRKNKNEFRSRSMIVGVTSPLAIKKLEAFGVMLLVSKFFAGSKKRIKNDSDSVFKGLRTKNSAGSVILPPFIQSWRQPSVSEEASFSRTLKSQKQPSPPSPSPSKKAKKLPRPKLKGCSVVEQYALWEQKGKDQTLLVSRHETVAYPIRKILDKIKKMDPDQRCLIGDKLLRDNLRELTVAFFQPNLSSESSLEHKNLRESAIEREELRKERQLEAHRTLQRRLRRKKGRFSSVLEWILGSIPTLIFWALLSSVLLLAFIVQVPPSIIIGIVLIFKFPDKAPKELEDLLDMLFPSWLIHPQRFLQPLQAQSSGNISALASSWVDGIDQYMGYPEDLDSISPMTPRVTQEEDLGQVESESYDTGQGGENEALPTTEFLNSQQTPVYQDSPEAKSSEIASDEKDASLRVDMSGIWKRIKLENYENFLAAQGASYLQRKLGCSIPMTHTITMSDDLMVMQLHEKGGPIDTQYRYEIDGPAIQTETMKKEFRDQAKWEGHRIKIVKTRLPDEDYQVVTYRWLENDNRNLKMEIWYKDRKDSRRDVLAYTYFEYAGPSLQPKPSSLPRPRNSPMAAAANMDVQGRHPSITHPTPPNKHKRTILKKDFSGEWQRVKTHNFEAFIGATGVGYLQRKLAAQMPLTHIITMNPPQLNAIRLQEKGGPLNTDAVLTIGVEFQPIEINKRAFLQRIYWDREGLIMQRRMEDNSYELAMTRDIDEDSNQLVLKSLYRDLQTGKEIEATSWFTRVGPSPNPMPYPDLVLLEEHAMDFAIDGIDEIQSEADLSEQLADHLDDNDEEDDEIALAKMKTYTTMKHHNFTSKLMIADLQASKLQHQHRSSSPFGEDSGRPVSSFSPNEPREELERPSEVSSIFSSSELSSSRDRPSLSKKTSSKKKSKLGQYAKQDLSGSWRMEEAPRPSLQPAAFKTTTHKDLTLKATYELALNRQYLHLRKLGSEGFVMEDSKYRIDHDYVLVRYMNKSYRAKCYWEGGTLILKKVSLDQKSECLHKFFLENQQQQPELPESQVEKQGNDADILTTGQPSIPTLRIVTVLKNLVTGIESESMALYRKKV